MISSTSRTLCLVILEGFIACSSGVAATFIRLNGPEAKDWLLNQQGWFKILLTMVIVQGSFYIFDLYDLRTIRHRRVLLTRIIQALGLASIGLAIVSYALPGVGLGRGVLLISLLLILTTMGCWRVFVTWLLGHPRLSERVLILGTDQNALNLAQEALERREVGYEIVGFVGDDPKLIGRSLINPSVVGLMSELEEVVHRQRADRVVVALSDQRGRLPLDALLRLHAKVIVEEASSFYERLTGMVSPEMLRPSRLIFSSNLRRMRTYKRARGGAEVALSLVGLVLSLPVMALVAIAIKLTSRGPVFYTQERVGLNNETFKIIKFRSMYADAEVNGPVWADQSDPRVTPLGRIIRKLRIDELPQFINVIRGEMSFIGPRPERPFFVEQLEREIPYYSQRHLVKPGLTGWAQIRYPYGASVDDALKKLQYDLYYLKNQSPLLDAIILFETVRIVLFGRGAR